MQPKPIYTTPESVKIRLAGKVTFESDGASLRSRPDRVMGEELLNQLICDAETAVEQDLRSRYAVPFRSKSGNTWASLPDHSKRAIRTIVDAKAVLFVLDESFGSGTHISGDGYTKTQEKKYTDLLRRLLGQDMEGEEYGEKRFRRTPPLEDMLLSSTNHADDGYRGAVIDAGSRVSSATGTEYAASRINDPSVGLYNFGRARGPR